MDLKGKTVEVKNKYISKNTYKKEDDVKFERSCVNRRLSEDIDDITDCFRMYFIHESAKTTCLTIY